MFNLVKLSSVILSIIYEYLCNTFYFQFLELNCVGNTKHPLPYYCIFI